MGADQAACLSEQFANPETQWSLGTFGAIGEFMRDTGEAAEVGQHSAVTARGGVRLNPHDSMQLFAFETATRQSWSQRVAICLPRDGSAMNHRATLTELGPDRDALRPGDRDNILFDIGLGTWQVDVCVRTNPDLAEQLRSHCGQETFAPGNPAGQLILAHSPHRVFVTRIGRLEVYQPIPPADGKSPDGPHTHVLPNLLRHRRTHSATEPIPDGLVPCGYFYPAHPAKDAGGHDKPYDPQKYASFETILRRYGNSRFANLKDQVRTAVEQDREPTGISTVGRHTVSNIRVALRQLRMANCDLPALARWDAAYERSQPDDDNEERHIHHR